MATFVLDAYKEWTNPQLKKRCRELVRAVSRLQDTVAVLGYLVPDINAVPKDLRQEVWNMMHMLSDDEIPPLPRPTLWMERKARPMSEEVDLDAIRKRAEAATAAPWTTEKPKQDGEGFSLGVAVAATLGRQMIYATPPSGQFPAADRDFIAHARTDIPELLDFVDRLRSSLAIKDKALVQAEWGALTPADDYQCPVCFELKEEGHAPDCLIAQALSHTTQERSK